MASGTLLLQHKPEVLLPSSASLSHQFRCFGYITGAGEDCYLFLPINTRASSVQISKVLLSVRTVDGTYVGGANNYDATQYLFSQQIVDYQNIFAFTLRKSGGWGITNNTPVTGYTTVTYTLGGGN